MDGAQQDEGVGDGGGYGVEEAGLVEEVSLMEVPEGAHMQQDVLREGAGVHEGEGVGKAEMQDELAEDFGGAAEDGEEGAAADETAEDRWQRVGVLHPARLPEWMVAGRTISRWINSDPSFSPDTTSARVASESSIVARPARYFVARYVCCR